MRLTIAGAMLALSPVVGAAGIRAAEVHHAEHAGQVGRCRFRALVIAAEPSRNVTIDFRYVATSVMTVKSRSVLRPRAVDVTRRRRQQCYRSPRSPSDSSAGSVGGSGRPRSDSRRRR